jgi:hypothetical protein
MYNEKNKLFTKNENQNKVEHKEKILPSISENKRKVRVFTKEKLKFAKKKKFSPSFSYSAPL